MSEDGGAGSPASGENYARIARELHKKDKWRGRKVIPEELWVDLSSDGHTAGWCKINADEKLELTHTFRPASENGELPNIHITGFAPIDTLTAEENEAVFKPGIPDAKRRQLLRVFSLPDFVEEHVLAAHDRQAAIPKDGDAIHCEFDEEIDLGNGRKVDFHVKVKGRFKWEQAAEGLEYPYRTLDEVTVTLRHSPALVKSQDNGKKQR